MVDREFGLTAGQNDIWLAQSLDPTSPTFRWGNYLKITGPVDVRVLRDVVEEVTREVDVLDLRIDGTTGAVTRGALRHPVEVFDLRDAANPHAQAEADMSAWLDEHADQLDAPLWMQRLYLVELGVVLWFQGFHHVVMDAAGGGMVRRAVADRYRARTEGLTIPGRRFGTLEQYLAGEDAYIKGPEYAKDAQYWSKVLDDAAPAATLYRLHAPSSAVRGFVRGTVTLDLGTSRALRDLASGSGLRSSRVVAGLVAGYLRRASEHQRLTLGLQVSGRVGEAARRTPMMAANILPLSVALRGTETLAEASVRLGDVIDGALAHQRYSLQQMRRDQGLEPGDPPTTLATLNILPLEQPDFGTGTAAELQTVTAPVLDDISFLILRSDVGDRVDVLGRADRYTADEVDEHAREIEHLARELCRRPDRALAAAHRRRCNLDALPQVAAPTSVVRTITDRIRTTADSDPDRPAVHAEDGTLTYAELTTTATSLAAGLRAFGVRPGQRVAVALPRTTRLIAALLAVHEAGASYVPVDPRHASARTLQIVEDSSPVLLVAEADVLPEVGLPRVGWEELWEHGRSQVTCPIGAAPDSEAYLIFTSGSTGRPKGVSITHADVARRIDGCVDRLGLASGRTWMSVHSASFDFSVWEVWGALATGGSVVVANESVVADPVALVALCARHRVHVLSQTPAALGFFVDAIRDTGAELDALDWVVLGGDRLTDEVWQVWEQRTWGRSCGLANMYGITETTVHVTDGLGSGVGRPLPGTTVDVLDEGLHPVAPYVVGEFYIGGAGLGRGYTGRPGLTATRFVATNGGLRLYRSGDLGYCDEDGGLHYVGRADDQVQIRGHRVEPAEVATVLSGGPARDVVVTADDSSSEPRLIAYCTAGERDEVLAYAREHLPAYMVPSAVVRLARVPMTANGKVDYARLPPVEWGAGVARSDGSPVSALAHRVAGVFATELGFAEVDPHASFYQLGGSSLTAMRIALRLRENHGLAVSVADVLRSPSPSALADTLKGAPAPAMEQPVDSDELLLTAGQEQLWFLQEATPSAAYNVVLQCAVPRDVNERRLARALGWVQERHEVLRMRIDRVDGAPRARLADPVCPLDTVTVIDADERRRVIEDWSGHVFDLAHEAPLRAGLVRGPDGADLLLVLHHVAVDAWSLRPLIRDLDAAYTADTAGPASAPAHRFADVARRLRAAYGGANEPGPASLEALPRWRALLADAPAITTLPHDRPRLGAGDSRGGRFDMNLTAPVYERVRQVAEAAGATPFMVLHASLAVALGRYGTGPDTVIGTPVAGRDVVGADDVVGYLVNTVPLRLAYRENDTFAELVARAREHDLAAIADQGVPFAQVIQAVQRARLADTHPLFQVMLAMQPSDRGGEAMTLLGSPVVQRTSGSARFDLTLSLSERTDGSGLGGIVEYAVDVYDPATVETFCRRWIDLLSRLCADPSATLGTVGAWSDIKVTASQGHLAPENVSFSSLLANAARDHPNRVALEFAGCSLTYSSLDRRCAAYADALRRQGVTRGSIVVNLLPRSAAQIVASLGIARVGATFLPIDPTYPPARIRFILQDSAASHVVAGPEQDLGSATCIAPPQLHDPAPADGVTPEASLVQPLPDEVAYLIYTSGSTGTPKGVAVPHRGVGGLVQTLREDWGIVPGSRILQFASPSFDASVLEIAMMLAGPGTLVCPGEHTLVGDELVAALADAAPTHGLIPPSALGTVDPASVVGLDRLAVGGEAISAGLARAWGAGRQMINAYGPTETTIVAASGPLDPGTVTALGAAVDGSTVRILDDALRPVPRGVVGEIYVSGQSLARGYHRRPGLTSTRYVASPFTHGGRLYRTGDFGTWSADGRVCFAGRADDQLKIAGHRIEPSETEAVLAALLPQGYQARVVARVWSGATPRLVAYICPCLTVGGDLRERLAAQLPAYLLPSAYVGIDTVPTTVHGKLDVDALPLPAEETLAADVASPLVAHVGGIMGSVLGRTIGPDDNFFAFGGTSLLVVDVVDRLRRELGQHVSIRDFFRDPTPAGVASRLGGAASGPELVAHPNGPGRSPLSVAQRRLWLLDQIDGPDATYTIPLVVDFEPTVDVDALIEAVRDVCDRQESLRTVIRIEGEEPVAVVRPTDEVVPVLREDVADDDLDRRIGEIVRQPFALEESTARFHVLVGTQQVILLGAVHHIVADGGSLRPLLEDLATAYEARRTETDPSWLSLPVRYADVARWQREVLGTDEAPSELARTEVEYWRRQLEGIPACIQLATDRPRPPVASHRGKQLRFSFPADLHAALRASARSHGTTVSVVLQAALAALLSKRGGGLDVVIGTPAAGRDRPETKGLVGFFVTTLALRVDLTGNPSFVELLARTTRAAAEAFSHQELPFEQVVEALNPPRSLSHHPVFQVLLVHQGEAVGEIRFGEIRGRLRPVDTGASRLDLALSVWEHVDKDGAATGVDGLVEFSSDLWDECSIESLVGMWGDVLRTVTDHPATRLAELLPAGAAATAGGPPPHPPVSFTATLRASLARNAERIAVVEYVDGVQRSITFAELDRRSAVLACLLNERGVGPGDVVGVFVEASADHLCAWLALAAVGATYLPLDPDGAPDRTGFVVRDAAPRVVLHRSGRALPWPVPGLAIDVVPAFIDDLTPPPNYPDGLVWLMYTSGSTGRPKGVMLPERSLVTMLDWYRTTVDSDGGAVSQLAPLGFDVAAHEMLVALAAGRCLVIPDPETRYDAEALVGLFAETGVTTLTVSNVVLQEIARVPDAAARLVGLRHIVQTGDALRLSEPLCDLFGELPGCTLTNLYGPTETYGVTATTLPGRVEEWPEEPGLGDPVWGVELLLLDELLSPVADGVPGEIYLAGSPVGRGYVGEPGLTAARFVAHPWSPGARMYRTGDLARRGPDNRLHYLGRADDQLKVRGIRVEVGEVERALLACRGIVEAAVAPVPTPTGSFGLAAYYTSAAPIQIAELRRALARLLPEAAVPSSFTRLDAMPLSRGKIDRAALPQVYPEERSPRGPRETLLAQTMAEVLDVPAVGMTDNFFELGGHSLLVTRLINRIRERFGADVEPRAVFEHPTVEGLVEHLEDGTGRPPLLPRLKGTAPALSDAQRRMWLSNEIEGLRATYNMLLCFDVDGRLDIEALRGALDDVTRRHESLRTVFANADGTPAPVILPADGLHVPVVVADIAASDVDAAVDQDAAMTFDLSRDTPLRAFVYRLPSEASVLLLVLHHIAGDGGSLLPLSRDLRAAYSARLSGSPWRPDDLPVQFADYVEWLHEYLGSPDEPDSRAATQVEYWRSALVGLNDPLELPIDRPRSKLAGYAGALMPIHVGEALYERLTAFARGRGVTLFMLLDTVLAGLLSRISGARDIAIGTPVSGRPDAALEDLIGPFLNTVVLRHDVQDDPSLLDLLTRTRRRILEAHAAQDVAFDRLVEAIRPPRSSSRHPFFQVMLALYSSRSYEMVLGDVVARPRRAESHSSRFDLTLSLTEETDGTSGSLDGFVEYATDLFDESTVQRLVDQWTRLLDVWVAEPEVRLSQVRLTSSRELADLHALAAPAHLDEPPAGLAALVASWAEARPDAPALRATARRWTYAELDTAVDHAAAVFADRGVERGSTVAVAAGRSAEQYLASLACSRLGAAFLPLDPNLPSDRLRYMLEDSGAGHLVTRDEETWGATGVLVIRVDALGELIAGPPPDASRHPREAEYVIYTSGSTGTPKGVTVPAAALTTLGRQMVENMAVTTGSSCLSIASPSFDASVLEWVTALVAGAEVVMAPSETITGEELADFVDAEHVSHLILSPALLDTVPRGRLASVEAVFVGGDRCSTALVERWGGTIPLFNGYGPTEATVAVTITPPLVDATTPPPIGLPMAPHHVWILDDVLHPVPVGVPGEIHVAEGLAHGYVGRPRLTAERFVAHPREPGQRLYRTGDIGRWREDGQIEFLGRLDDQVKIRGFRVELGEIRQRILDVPSVADATVLAANGTLLAFVVPSSPEAADDVVTLVLGHLRAVLPTYMVPRRVNVVLDFPRTHSGKIDGQRLLAECASDDDSAFLDTAPMEPVLARTCAIFAEVLERRVGPDDDFFDLGGHSLLATQLIARLKHDLGTPLRLADLFACPTPRQLRLLFEASPVGLPVLKPQTRSERPPLSFAQQRLWFLQAYEGATTYNVPLALRLRGDLDIDALDRALRDIIVRHEPLRTTYPSHDGEPYQRIATPGEVDARWSLRIRERTSGAMDADLLAEASHSFDLVEELPVAATLFVEGPGQHVLVLVIHHIACDGWSMRPLVHDLASAYRARRDGREPELPPLAVTYTDYAIWQREMLSIVGPDGASELDRQVGYWRHRLDGAAEVTSLPTDYPRPAHQSYTGGQVFDVVDSALHDRIHRIARATDSTPFMVLHAALVVLLNAYGAGDDITVGTAVANRTDSALEDLVGFFVNSLPLRTRVRPEVTFEELVAKNREDTLAAYAHQDVPFEYLVHELNPSRSRAYHPFFQVMLALQNTRQGRLDVPGLEVEFVSLDVGTSRFDLFFSVWETFTPDGHPDGMDVGLEYAADLFAPETPAELLRRFLSVLNQVTDTPGMRLSEVNLIDDDETARLLELWSMGED